MQLVKCDQVLTAFLTNLVGATPAQQTALWAALKTAGLCAEVNACITSPGGTIGFAITGSGGTAALTMTSGAQTASVSITALCTALAAAGCSLGGLTALVTSSLLTGLGTAASPLTIDVTALSAAIQALGTGTTVIHTNGLSGAGTSASPLGLNYATICSELVALGCSLGGLQSVTASAPLTGAGTAASPLALNIGAVCAALSAAGCSLSGPSNGGLVYKAIPATGLNAPGAFVLVATIIEPDGSGSFVVSPVGNTTLFDSANAVVSPGPYSAVAVLAGALDISRPVRVVYN
jgi:hypothetical protein